MTDVVLRSPGCASKSKLNTNSYVDNLADVVSFHEGVFAGWSTPVAITAMPRDKACPAPPLIIIMSRAKPLGRLD